MAELKGNSTFSFKKRKQPDESSDLETRNILEMFHCGYYRWVRLKERTGKCAGAPMLRAMTMWQHRWSRLANAGGTSGFQYFLLSDLKNSSAFEKCFYF